jgi:DNA-directed RNA polymerase specialized sigma subunit
MTARLRRYRVMVAEYEACAAYYERLFTSGTATLSDMPRAVPKMFEIERTVYKRLDLAAQMELNLREQAQEIADILILLLPLANDEAAILTGRYIMGETWEQVAAHVKKSKSQVERVHDRAIEKLIGG